MRNKITIWVAAVFISIICTACITIEYVEYYEASVISYLHNNLDEPILATAKFYPLCTDTTEALVTWSDSLVYIAPGETGKIMDYVLASKVELYWADDTTYIATHCCQSEDFNIILIPQTTPSDFKDAVIVQFCHTNNSTLLGIQSDRYSLDSIDFNYYSINDYGDNCNSIYSGDNFETRKRLYENTCPGYAVIKYYELDLSAECFNR